MPLIKLSDEELTQLGNRIRDEWQLAKSAHATRLQKAKDAYNRFRNRVDPSRPGEERVSNVRMPLIQWQSLAELAREGVALFGDDSQVIAKPTGPADQKLVRKVSRFMDWRLFDSMRATNAFLEFMFRKIVYGRSFAYSPWKRETYRIVDEQGKKQTAIWYEGPGFTPLWPDEVIVPPESVHSVQEFSWVIVRSRLTWDDLLRGEVEGRYFGVKKNLERIKGWAQGSGERSAMGDEVRSEADDAEGVVYRNAYATRGSLEVWDWYGTSEPDKDGYRDEWMVTYLPDLQMVIGVQDLAEIYPQSKNRRPIVEASLIPNGDYWGPGFAELLETWEEELTANENLFTDAAQFSVGPIIFYNPAAGFSPDKFKYEPFMALPSADPASIRVVQPTLNPAGYEIKQQSTLAIAERITGLSDQAMGRSIDRPNAPRTASGQAMLLQQGDVRMSLNMIALREDMARVLEHIWELECQFPNAKGTFFRVTEEDAGGLFDVHQGGAVMDRQDFAGRYDFDVRFATSNWDRAAKKQDAVQLFQAAAANPIIIQNPKAMWAVTNDLYKAFGNDHFSDIVPEPPTPDIPRNPREEWTLMLQGEGDSVHVNPQDDDDAHMIDHQKRLNQQAEAIAVGGPVNKEAVDLMLDHIVDHRQQKKAKVTLQAVTQKLAEGLGNMAGAAMMPEGPDSLVAQNIQGPPMQPGIQGPPQQVAPPGPQQPEPLVPQGPPSDLPPGVIA